MKCHVWSVSCQVWNLKCKDCVELKKYKKKNWKYEVKWEVWGVYEVCEVWQILALSNWASHLLSNYISTTGLPTLLTRTLYTIWYDIIYNIFKYMYTKIYYYVVSIIKIMMYLETKHLTFDYQKLFHSIIPSW